MSATVIDVVSAQLEQVRPVLADYTDGSTNLYSMLKENETVETTRYLYRIPFLQWVGGTYRKYSADGGSMGTGNGMKISKLEAGFFDSTYNFELTLEQLDTTQKGARAIIDIVAETLDRAMTWMSKYNDIELHGDGTGKLTNAASSGTSTTLTFNSASDTLGVNRLFVGMQVDVWDSTGATKRAGGPYQITALDYNSKTVTFGSAVTGIASTDLLAFANMDAYGPSTLTSFSSTWPGGGLTNGPGLTGDSWRHGLAYVNDNDTSRYYLQLQKSAYPQLMPGYVNASGYLTYMTFEQLRANIYQARDEEAVKDLMGVMHMAQLYQLKQIGVSISSILYGPGQGAAKVTDILPNDSYSGTFTAGDFPLFVSKAADKSRVDFFKKSNWFKVQSAPPDYVRFGGSNILRPVYNTSGETTAAMEFKIVHKMDTGCVDPGAGGYIYNLTVPSGF